MAFNCYMHPRNIYRIRPDFQQLVSEFPEFSECAIYDERGRVHVNFKDANTLRCLTKTLLKKDFGLNISIPENCLIPTVPQRLNYILWIEDLLNTLSSTNEPVRGIDIGTGPCCIFSVLGAKKNGWKFLATESEAESIKWGSRNIVENDLQGQIEICKVDKEIILKGAVNNQEKTFDFCMCNPPFFHNLDEMHQRKKSLTGGEADVRVKQNEVMVQGGEVEFIRKMILDSVELKERIKIYTSMFGKKKSLVEIKNDLKNLDNVNFIFTEFCQGNTMRWGVAWTFVKGVNLSRVYCSKRKKKKKPMNFLIPKRAEGYSVKNLLRQVVTILQELSIQYEVEKETRLNVVLLLQSNENTWSHQRRKRRQAQQVAKMGRCVSSEKSEEAENLSRSFNTDCGVSVADVESSETPFQMVEHMDLEASSGRDDLSSVAEVTSAKTKNFEVMETEDADPSTGMNESLSPSCNVAEMLDTDSCVKNTTGSIKRKRNLDDMTQDCDVKLAKTMCGETQNTSSVLSAPSESGSVPLLFCNLELKRHCDKIMLEMSCEEHCNRQSMSEILQLFKNRLK